MNIAIKRTLMAPVDWLFGQVGARIIFPAAERYLRRNIREKYEEMKRHYNLPFSERLILQRKRLVQTLEWSAAEVPYYRDLFAKIKFEPQKVLKDLKYFSEVPFLTKKEILEQGQRLVAQRLVGQLSIQCKTGGSTGGSVFIEYDRAAADESSAVTLFARTLSGKFLRHRELHFASRFLEAPSPQSQRFDRLKELALNRANIYFDDLNETELLQIWSRICRYRPHLVHAHPSTGYALALAVEKSGITQKAFKIFESSGELLDQKKRRKIQGVFGCEVFDRYGLAELGIVAYQNKPNDPKLRVFDDVAYAEIEDSEIVLTALKNKYMPLIRYRTGDLARLEVLPDGYYFSEMSGRVHDLLTIGSRVIPTHHIQDVLDRIGGIVEFQIEKEKNRYVLKIVTTKHEDQNRIGEGVGRYFGSDLDLRFVSLEDLVKVGDRQKFRYLVEAQSRPLM